MPRTSSTSLSNFVQLVLFGALVAASTALWIWRDDVAAAFATRAANSPDVRTRSRAPRAVPVIVAPVATQQDRETVAAVGTGKAIRAAMIRSQSDGRIVSLAIRGGERVKRGQKLFRVDSVQAELALRIAKRKLADAERQWRRSEFLKSRRVGSGASIEDTHSAVKMAQLEVQQATKTLADMTIVAPFDGVVAIPSVEPGERVTSTTPVVAIDDRSALTVEFRIPERFFPKLRAGQSLRLQTPGYPNTVFNGKIKTIDSRVDPTSRSITVRAEVPNKRDVLRPGMFFSVSLTFTGDTVPIVPQLALQWRGGDSYVWVVRGGIAHKTKVRALRRLNQTVLVVGALTAGDLVVVEGVQRVRDGRRVSFEHPDKAQGGQIHVTNQSKRSTKK